VSLEKIGANFGMIITTEKGNLLAMKNKDAINTMNSSKTCRNCLHFDGDKYCVFYYRNGEWDEEVKERVWDPDEEFECEDFVEADDD
jgi:hypothetical protein